MVKLSKRVRAHTHTHIEFTLLCFETISEGRIKQKNSGKIRSKTHLFPKPKNSKASIN